MRSRGFSLLEMILALTLVLTVVMMVLNLLPSSRATVVRSEHQLQADNLAQTVLAEQMAMPFSALVLGEHPLDARSIGGATFTPSLEIFQVDGRDTLRLKGLRVTVAWSERTVPRSVVHEVWVPNVSR
ncbi:MAG: type II secretion system protein [Armatimonadetes bacterium]|nr:type II secretion system protein [Armatimonadota bacterium]